MILLQLIIMYVLYLKEKLLNKLEDSQRYNMMMS